jgi:hypothetical protein
MRPLTGAGRVTLVSCVTLPLAGSALWAILTPPPRNAYTRQLEEQNLAVERWAANGLPQYSHCMTGGMHTYGSYALNDCATKGGTSAAGMYGRQESDAEWLSGAFYETLNFARAGWARGAAASTPMIFGHDAAPSLSHLEASRQKKPLPAARSAHAARSGALVTKGEETKPE